MSVEAIPVMVAALALVAIVIVAVLLFVTR